MPERKCNCSQYPYPHRFMGGKCSGWLVVCEVAAKKLCAENCPFLRKADGRFLCRLLVQSNVSPEQCPSLERVLS